MCFRVLCLLLLYFYVLLSFDAFEFCDDLKLMYCVRVLHGNSSYELVIMVSYTAICFLGEEWKAVRL